MAGKDAPWLNWDTSPVPDVVFEVRGLTQMRHHFPTRLRIMVMESQGIDWREVLLQDYYAPTYATGMTDETKAICVKQILDSPQAEDYLRATMEKRGLNLPLAALQAKTEAEIAERTADITSVLKSHATLIHRDNGALTVKWVNLWEGTLEVELSGSCSSCGSSDRTLYRNLGKSAGELGWIRRNGEGEVNAVYGQRAEVDAAGLAVSVELGRSGVAAGGSGYTPDAGMVASL